MAITNALDPVAGQPQQGDWQFDGVFGVNSASQVSITGSELNLTSAGNIALNSTGGAVQLTSGDVSSFNFSSLDITSPTVNYLGETTFIHAADSTVTINGVMSIMVNDSYTFNGSTVSFNGGCSVGTSFGLSGITVATGDHLVYYNTTTNAVTTSPVPAAFDPAANYTITGDWTFEAGFVINSTGSVISVTTDDEFIVTSAGITRLDAGILQLTSPDQEITSANIEYLGANTAFLYSTDVTVTTNGLFNITVNDSWIFSGTVITFTSGFGLNTGATITWNAPPSGVTGQVLYFNSGTDAVTVGAAPTTRLNYQGIPGTTQALVADQAYITAAGTLTTCTLPATAAVGDTFVVVGESVGLFRIAQNAGQSIRLGGSVSTAGVTGYIDSVGQGAVIEIVCTITDSNFMVVDSIGNFNVV